MICSDAVLRRATSTSSGLCSSFLGQALDLVGEGRREQQVLSTRRQFGQYATDVMDKAHIQHTVRFVQHEDFNFIKTDGV
ncbi:Uncharacterised protein [Klebsiella pneumoniae]|uniref:Uncharacterized protein n=1 Tax=Klebsiella pneumoniae TaxID=573 RepID=A0A378BH47_KLEPN|nr:Uncharacterised protein [Klebsiella pneumoniae]